MKEINFIVTCFNKELYWPYLKQIIESYQHIKPNIVLCYNGIDENFKKEANIVIENTGHQHGEASLILKGLEYAERHFSSNLFVKLSIDSWLLKEDVILDIFNHMEQNNICYAGNFWNTNHQLSVDIFFINTSPSYN
jgi:molybdopterin-guanine dinucleotide biosynthesis protein A